MTMENLIQRQRAARAKQNLTDMLDSWERQQKDVHRLSATRALIASSKGCFRTDAPAEFEAWGCVDGNEQRFSVPYTYLVGRALARRDLNTVTAGALVNPATDPLALPLIGSGLAQAGANLVLNVQQDAITPVVSTKPPLSWLPDQTTSIPTDATTVLGQSTATCHRGGISIRASRQLTLQAENFASTIDRLLIQLGNDAVDVAGLNGSGAAGQPLGLMNNPGIAAVSGASMNLSGLSTMEENAVASDAGDSGLTWFASTDTRRILRQRELSTGGGSIWPGNELLGHRTITTSKMPAASLLIGDFSNVDVLLFGGGVEVLVDPFSNFQSGAITFQVAVAMDLKVNYPAAFRKSTTVS